MSLQGLNIKAKLTELDPSKLKKLKINDEKNINDNILDLSDSNRLAEEINSQDISKVKAVKINDKLVTISPKELKEMVENLKNICINKEGKLNTSFAIDLHNKTGITLYQTELNLEEIHQLESGIQKSEKSIETLNAAFTKKTDLSKLFSDTEIKLSELKLQIESIEKNPDNSLLKKDALIKLKNNVSILETNMKGYKEALPKAQEIIETSANLEEMLAEKKGSASKTAIKMADESAKLQSQLENFPESIESLSSDLKLKAMATIDIAGKATKRSIDGIKVSQAENSQKMLRKGTSMYSIHTTFEEFKKLVHNGQRKGYPPTPEGFIKSAIDDVKSDAALANKLTLVSTKIKQINFASLDNSTRATKRAEVGKEIERLFQYQGSEKYFIKPATVQAVKEIYMNQFDLAATGQKINEVADLQKVLQMAQNDLVDGLKQYLGMEDKTDKQKKDKDSKLADLQTNDTKNQQSLNNIKNKTTIIKNTVDSITPDKVDVDKLGFGVKTTGTLKSQQNENIATKKILKEKIEKLEAKNLELEKTNASLDKKVKIEVGHDFITKNLQGYTSRAVMNKLFDKNGDGKITLDEMRNMDVNALKKLANEAGRGYIADNAENIELYINSLADKDGSTVIIDFDKNEDYQSYWQFRGDSATTEINEMKAKDSVELRKKLQDELSKKAGYTPDVQALIDNLSKNGQLSAVNLQAINRILDSGNGRADLSRVSEKLNDFIASEKGRFTKAQKIEIANDILHDLAYPADIDQDSKGTCSAAATQMRTAIYDPLKYTNIITTLAKDEDYQTEKGDKLHHNDTYMDDESDGRSLSSKIIQNSFMDFAHSYTDKGAKDGKETRYYDSRISIDGAQGLEIKKEKFAFFRKKINYLKDTDDDNIETLGGGLYSNQIDHLEGSIFGNVSDVKDGYFTRSRFHNTKEDIVDDIEDSVKAGIPVTIDFKGHSVIVQGIDDKQNPKKYIIDSWSKQFEMTREQLEKSIRSARLED